MERDELYAKYIGVKNINAVLKQQNAALVEACKTVIDSLIPEDERNDGDPLFEDAKVFDAYELAQQALAQVGE